MEMTALLDEAAYAETLIKYQPRPIHDDAENERATAMLIRLSESEHITAEQEAVAEILVMLIEGYEERYALNASTPLSMLQELMLANDLKQKDIVPLIGSKGVTSEVLSGKREISKAMAANLGKRFNVPHTLFL
jgi:HTH-type transcriptional regulator/antitoxin HigA